MLFSVVTVAWLYALTVILLSIFDPYCTIYTRMDAAVIDKATLPWIQASQLARTPSRTPGCLYDQP